MTIYRCDGCTSTLDPAKDVYYTVGELTKHIPRMPFRVLFKEGATELRAEDTGWVSYEDLHYCVPCAQNVVDVGGYLRKGS